MLTIITTVGLSLINNYNKPEFGTFFEDKYPGKGIDLFDSKQRAAEVERLSNQNCPILKNETIPKVGRGEKASLGKLEYLLYGVKPVKNAQGLPAWESIEDASPEEKKLPNDFACAETRTIREIISNRKATKVKLVFLASDTFLSCIIAEKLKERYECYDIVLDNGEIVEVEDKIEVEFIKGLQVLDSYKFENQGFSELLKQVKKVRKEAVDKQNIIVNISGGYKMIIPPMTIFGQLLGFDLCYIYEDGDTLIELGQLPIAFDIAQVESYAPYLFNEHKAAEIKGKNEQKLLDELVSFKLLYKYRKDNELFFCPSGWGRLLKSFIQENAAAGTSSTGYIAEFLLYHYFTKNLVNPVDNFSAFELAYGEKLRLKSAKKKEKNGVRFTDYDREYDLIFHKEKSDLILAEVKSYYRVLNHFADVREGIFERLKEFENEAYQTAFHSPKEFHLAIWKLKEPRKSFEPLLDQLRELKDELKEAFPAIKFRAYGFNLNNTRREGKEIGNPIKNILNNGVYVVPEQVFY